MDEKRRSTEAQASHVNALSINTMSIKRNTNTGGGTVNANIPFDTKESLLSSVQDSVKHNFNINLNEKSILYVEENSTNRVT